MGALLFARVSPTAGVHQTLLEFSGTCGRVWNHFDSTEKGIEAKYVSHLVVSVSVNPSREAEMYLRTLRERYSESASSGHRLCSLKRLEQLPLPSFTALLAQALRANAWQSTHRWLYVSWQVQCAS